MERKRLGAVAAEVDALVVLEEPQVEPRDNPPELHLFMGGPHQYSRQLACEDAARSIGRTRMYGLWYPSTQQMLEKVT